MTWLLLRGLCREQGHWGAFPGMLAQRIGNTPVVCVDLPGNGVFYDQKA